MGNEESSTIQILLISKSGSTSFALGFVQKHIPNKTALTKIAIILGRPTTEAFFKFDPSVYIWKIEITTFDVASDDKVGVVKFFVFRVKLVFFWLIHTLFCLTQTDAWWFLICIVMPILEIWYLNSLSGFSNTKYGFELYCCVIKQYFFRWKFPIRWRECVYLYSWWRHQIETCFALLAICTGNSPVTGEFPVQRPLTQSFSLICAWTNGWVNNGEAGDFRRHRAQYYVTVMLSIVMAVWASDKAPCWRQHIETFSASMALCDRNTPVTGEFPTPKGQKFRDSSLLARTSCWTNSQLVADLGRLYIVHLKFISFFFFPHSLFYFH